MIGVIGTQYLDLPPTVDEAYLQSLQTASGLELTDLVRLVDQAMGTLNTEFDDVIASLIGVTSKQTTGRRGIGRRHVKKGGEYSSSRPQRTEWTEHMLPYDKFDTALGFTEDGLFAITLEEFNRELQEMVKSWRAIYKGEVFSALFDPTPVPIARGSAVLSPRFAGSGTGDYAFTGTYPNGASLPVGYSHYYRTSEANLATTIAEIVKQLRRWYAGPFDLVGTTPAIDQVTALERFVTVGESGINPGQGVPTATLDSDVYLGQYPGQVRVRQPEDQLGTTAHFAIYKSQGAFAADNPLAWFYDEKRGRNAYVRGKDDFPLAEAAVIQWFGIGANDRAAASLAEINDTAGAYAPPVVSF